MYSGGFLSPSKEAEKQKQLLNTDPDYEQPQPHNGGAARKRKKEKTKNDASISQASSFAASAASASTAQDFSRAVDVLAHLMPPGEGSNCVYIAARKYGEQRTLRYRAGKLENDRDPFWTSLQGPKGLNNDRLNKEAQVGGSRSMWLWWFVDEGIKEARGDHYIDFKDGSFFVVQV